MQFARLMEKFHGNRLAGSPRAPGPTSDIHNVYKLSLGLCPIVGRESIGLLLYYY